MKLKERNSISLQFLSGFGLMLGARKRNSTETSNVFKFWPKLFNERTSHHTSTAASEHIHATLSCLLNACRLGDLKHTVWSTLLCNSKLTVTFDRNGDIPLFCANHFCLFIWLRETEVDPGELLKKSASKHFYFDLALIIIVCRHVLSWPCRSYNCRLRSHLLLVRWYLSPCRSLSDSNGDVFETYMYSMTRRFTRTLPSVQRLQASRFPNVLCHCQHN